MNSRDVTIAGYLIWLTAGLLLQVLARRQLIAVPTLGAVLGRALRTRPGRVALIAGWAWIGLHFFAR